MARRTSTPSQEDQSQPSSSNKRRKVTRACDVCKAKKKACTGDIPCTWCARHKITCTYQSAYNRGAPVSPRPSLQMNCESHNTPPTTSNRSDSVHTVLHGPQKTQTPEPIQRPPAMMVIAPSAPETDPVVHVNPAIEEPNSREQAMLQPSRGVSPEAREPREIAGQYSGPASAHSFLYRVVEKFHQSEYRTAKALAPGDVPSDKSIFTFGDAQFPDLDESQAHFPDWSMTRECVRRYFEFASPTYRILHQGTVEQWVDKIYQQAPVAETAKAIVLMICAISSLYHVESTTYCSTNQATTDQQEWQQGEVFYTMALRIVDNEVGSPSLQSIQVRFLMVLYLLSSSRMNKAWFTFGTMVQLLMTLGLHRRRKTARTTSSSMSNAQRVQHECQKRILWCSFTLEKYLSLMLGRPRLLQEDDIDQEFPSPLNDEDLVWNEGFKPKPARDTVMFAPVAHARLAQVLARAAKELYAITPMSHAKQMETIQDLTSQISDWQKQLPTIFSGDIKPSSLVAIFRRQLTVLRLAYFHAVMFVTRPLLLKNYAKYNFRDYNRLYRPHIDACITAARDTMELVLEFVDDKQLFTAFWYTQYITFNALSIIYLYLLQVKGGRIQAFQASFESYGVTGTKSNESRLQQLAETTFHHLARVTVQNAPHMRYAAILEGLRTEVNSSMLTPPQEQLPQEVSDELNWSRFLESLGPTMQRDYANATVDDHVEDTEATAMSHAFTTYEQTAPLNYPGDIPDYDVYAAQAQQPESLLSAYDDLGLDFWSQMDSLPISYTNIQNV
ncbi:hypothetical protein DPV78_006796 [Talaromyces pinophilus]|nr:hypothetical protein DPV78_006796 [Talaromyces pinophilus]